jgi:putative aldouronate transport system substrate-binding protein
MSKRLLLVLIVLVAAAGLAMAAGGGEKPAASNVPTLSIVVSQVEADDMDWNTFAKNPADFPVLQAAEKALGFKLKIESNNDYGSLLLPRIAAKVNLPDTFVMGGGFDIVKLATDGVIIPLGDLIAANAPETVALWKQFPDIKHDTIAPDGNIYGYPGGVQPYLNRLNQLGTTYRADWAKKLGLGEPMTVADWYTMLTAFKTGDPNGNGKKDEIPYSARYGNCLNVFAGAYGLSAFNEWWSVAADGKTVLYDWSSAASKDNAKAFLTEMNKWYREGLIPAEFGSDLGDKMDALGLTNMVGADMHWTLYAPETNTAMAKDYPGANWVVAFPAKGPTGLVGSEQYGPVNNERWMVTTTAKERKTDVLAVKFRTSGSPLMPARPCGAGALKASATT